MKSLTSIPKSTKVSGHLLLSQSADKQISKSASQLKCGFLDVAETVIDAESRLEFQKIIGYHQTSRAGFGSFKSPSIPGRNSHEYRRLISDLVGEVDENAYHAKSVQLHLQGYWTKWCDFVKNDLSWKTLLAMPSSLISLCLGATFDTLSSPSNLKRWRLITESSCFLCRKSICTSAHILGACKIALHQGRFRFRHDKDLCELVVILKNFLSSYKPIKSSVINLINFVREGKKPKTAPRKGFLGVLDSASDWNLEFDLDGMLVVPVFLAVSTLRLDILLFSRSTKKVIIIELTCPCEQDMSQWHEEKSQKYYPLCCSIRPNGWSVYFYATEVGALDFCAESVRSCLRSLGFNNRLCGKTLQTLSSVSLRCSFEIWLCRNSKSWSLPHPVSWSKSEPTQKKSNFNGVSAHNDHHACTLVYSVPSRKTANKHCGIINKGNPCYANVILQCLKIFPVLWFSNDHIKSTLYSSVRKITFQLHSAKSPINPSFFLKCLKDIFFREGRSFDLHNQQDVVEVLEIILEELTGSSIITSAAYNIKSLTSTTCHTCHQQNRRHLTYTSSSRPQRFSCLAC